MFNKVGAAYMFLMAGCFLFFAWAWIDNPPESGAWVAAVPLVFTLGFVALGVWLLRQR